MHWEWTKMTLILHRLNISLTTATSFPILLAIAKGFSCTTCNEPIFQICTIESRQPSDTWCSQLSSWCNTPCRDSLSFHFTWGTLVAIGSASTHEAHALATQAYCTTSSTFENERMMVIAVFGKFSMAWKNYIMELHPLMPHCQCATLCTSWCTQHSVNVLGKPNPGHYTWRVFTKGPDLFNPRILVYPGLKVPIIGE